MAYIRRGCVPRYYEGPPTIPLTNLDGSLFVLNVAAISCFEEHSIPKSHVTIVTVYHGVRKTAVAEAFDTVLARLGEKAVSNG